MSTVLRRAIVTRRDNGVGTHDEPRRRHRSYGRKPPDATAIAADGRDVSYRDFWTRTGRFAAALSEYGIEPSDRVALYLPNVPDFLTAFHGVLRAGGVVVPMNPQYKAREIGHLLADNGARLVVTLADLTPRVEAVMDDTDVT